MVQQQTLTPITLNDVKVKIDGSVVGFIQKVSVKVPLEYKKIREAGSDGHPVAKVQTVRDVSGSFDRTFVSAELLKQLAPQDGKAPDFDLECQIPQEPDRSFLVKSCSLKGFAVEMDLENPSTQTLEFEALRFTWLA